MILGFESSTHFQNEEVKFDATFDDDVARLRRKLAETYSYQHFIGVKKDLFKDCLIVPSARLLRKLAENYHYQHFIGVKDELFKDVLAY